MTEHGANGTITVSGTSRVAVEPDVAFSAGTTEIDVTVTVTFRTS